MEETGLNKRFRANLRAERDRQGMSQSELSRRLVDSGWSTLGHQTTLHRIESGARPVKLDEAGAIADALGVRLETMLRDAESFAFRRGYSKAWGTWRELGDLGARFMNEQVYLEKRMAAAVDQLGDDETQRAQKLLDQSPGDAAMAGIRAYMEDTGVEDYREYRARWGQRQAERQAEETALRRKARQEREGGDNGAS